MSDFIHKIGHEIGNPLTAILSFATIIERYGFDPSKTPEAQNEQLQKLGAYAQSIGSEAWRVSLLSDRLVLLLSCREPHLAPLDLERSLSKILMKIANRFPELTNAVPIEVEVHPPVPQVSSDNEEVSSLFFELLLNASQATERYLQEAGDSADVAVRCNLESKDGHLTLTIENPTATRCPFELEDIFLPFVTDAAERRRLGLGLAVAAAIAERLNLVLEIEEEERDNAYFFRSRVIFN